jgi:hypothetical protein
MAQATTRDRPIINPGARPARKSWEIETLAATPKTIKPIDGGITGAMMPPAAMRPAARGISYPAFRIMGIRIAARAAVSAAAEPDNAARISAATIAT